MTEMCIRDRVRTKKQLANYRYYKNRGGNTRYSKVLTTKELLSDCNTTGYKEKTGNYLSLIHIQMCIRDRRKAEYDTYDDELKASVDKCIDCI